MQPNGKDLVEGQGGFPWKLQISATPSPRQGNKPTHQVQGIVIERHQKLNAHFDLKVFDKLIARFVLHFLVFPTVSREKERAL